MLVLLPHQLFKINLLPKDENIILWEHPQYFTKYNFNKKKLRKNSVIRSTPPTGIEPMTSRLTGVRSNQLS